MKLSCIDHPERQPLLLLRQWQIEFCDGNPCAAALLSYFEYWHNVKLNRCAETGQEPTAAALLQFHSEQALREGIFGLYGAHSIRDARRLLAAKGVITEHNNPNPRFAFDRTRHFLFHPEPVNAWLAARSRPTAPDAATSGAATTATFQPSSTLPTSAASADPAPCELTVRWIPAATLPPSAARWVELPAAPAALAPVIPPAAEQGQGAPVALATPTLVSCGKNANSCSETADWRGETAVSSLEISPEVPSETPTPPDPPTPAAALNRGCGHRLIFDFHLTRLTPEEQARAADLLRELEPDLAQQVLDEWNMAWRGGKMREPWAWLRTVANHAQQGGFTPTHNLNARRQVAIQREIPRETPPLAIRQPISTLWQRGQAWLREQFGESTFNRYLSPTRSWEDHHILWLAAPNRYVADWIGKHLTEIAQILRPPTPLEIRVCVG